MTLMFCWPQQTPFFRVILDEAHFVKNRATITAKACYALQASRRWVLTGTPIQVSTSCYAIVYLMVTSLIEPAE
jgi:hypothetical protein